MLNIPLWFLLFCFAINTKCRKTRFPIPLHLHPFCNTPSQEAKDFIDTSIPVSKGFSIADAVNLKTHKVYKVVLRCLFVFPFNVDYTKFYLLCFLFACPGWVIAWPHTWISWVREIAAAKKRDIWLLPPSLHPICLNPPVSGALISPFQLPELLLFYIPST